MTDENLTRYCPVHGRRTQDGYWRGVRGDTEYGCNAIVGRTADAGVPVLCSKPTTTLDLHDEISEFMERFENTEPTDDEVRQFFEKCAPKLMPGDPEGQRDFVNMMMKLREPIPGEEE